MIKAIILFKPNPAHDQIELNLFFLKSLFLTCSEFDLLHPHIFIPKAISITISRIHHKLPLCDYIGRKRFIREPLLQCIRIHQDQNPLILSIRHSPQLYAMPKLYRKMLVNVNRTNKTLKQRSQNFLQINLRQAHMQSNATFCQYHLNKALNQHIVMPPLPLAQSY